jgi:ABC-type dipeptide/oligopeptide/nickel transport system ATPase component
LVGESGSGKSVTALSIMRLVPEAARPCHADAITLDGTDLLRLSRGRGRESPRLAHGDDLSRNHALAQSRAHHTAADDGGAAPSSEARRRRGTQARYASF